MTEPKLEAASLLLFEGGSETGELMKSIDWGNTPLGNVEEWPQSLKTCVRIILTSSQPMFVWWGKELINLYNDPYKAIVGGKHPWALGKPASEVWSEIWDQAGPRVETVMKENKGTYDEALMLIMERNGYAEETYYTFSYSPVPGDDGIPGGIICANTDDTWRIIGERRLRTLKDLGKLIMDCKNIHDVYQNTITILAQNPHDFPVATLYELKENNCATLAGSTLKSRNFCATGTEIDLHAESKIASMLREVIKHGKTEVFNNASEIFQQLHSEHKTPENALVLPIMQTGHTKPFALLLVGLSPYNQPNEKYLDFFRLVSEQVATAGQTHLNFHINKKSV